MTYEEKIVVFQRDVDNLFFAYDGQEPPYWSPHICYAWNFSSTNADINFETGKLVQYNKITEYIPTGITGKDAFKEKD